MFILHTHITRWATCGLAALLLVAGLQLPAFAQADALEAELKSLATEAIKPALEKKEFKVVAVGAFNASASIVGNNGPQIQTKLSTILEGMGFTMKTEDFQAEITGNFLPAVDPGTKLNGVKIVARVSDTDGTTLGEFSRFVFGTEAVSGLLGLNIKTSPNADAQTKSDAIKEAVKNPSASTNGNKVSATPDSKFGMEIQILQDGKYVPVTPEPNPDKKNLPFVDIPVDTVYAIRLINEAEHEAAIKLTIDGLSTFEFCEMPSKPQVWIVPKRSSILIKGWMKTATSTVEFKATDFPNSAAATKLNIKTSPTIGTITAIYSAAWNNDDDKPADEASSRGTGFGNQIENKIQQVTKFIGATRETVTLRYVRPLPQ